MRFAAIDVGSNAVRLLLSQVYENGGPAVFKKDCLIRYPLRLGEEAFAAHCIPGDKADQFVRVMAGFRSLIDAYGPLAYRACATAALREADNRLEILDRVRSAAGLEIEVVDGRTEAEIIYANHSERNLNEQASFLYIDVGGGSTELTVFSAGRCLASRSFNIGAIRLLQDLVPQASWRDMKRWIAQNAAGLERLSAIGSGGNINKAFMLSGRKPDRPLSFKKLKEISHFLSRFDVEERVRLLGLRPDRADVIVPALRIFLRVMKWADIRRLHVPIMGLSDGLIHQLYEKHKGLRSSAPPSPGRPPAAAKA